MPELTTDVVVIGGGPAGLLTAIILGKRGLSVHLIESRENPSATPLPQHGHVHNLLLGSQYALFDSVPEIRPILEHAGAIHVDWNGDFLRSTPAGIGASSNSRDRILVARREDWDEALWKIAADTPSVTILTGYEVTGLSGDHHTVQVRLSSKQKSQASRQEQLIETSLCVDASGRTQVGLHLLKANGLKVSTKVYKTPMHYRSIAFRYEPEKPHHKTNTKQPSTPAAQWSTKPLAAVEVDYFSEGGIRGAMMLPSSSYSFLISAVSSDRADLESFSQSPKTWLHGLNQGIVGEAIAALHEERASERQHGWSRNYLHHFESSKLKLPIIVVGDALCSTAPILGLGMSRSILDALLVSSSLNKSGSTLSNSSLNDKAHAIRKALARQAERDMEIAKMLAFEMGTLEKVSPLLRAKVLFRDFFLSAATTDPVLHQLYIDIRNRTRSNNAVFSPTSLFRLTKYALHKLFYS